MGAMSLGSRDGRFYKLHVGTEELRALHDARASADPLP